jgi:hypothetical protein
VERTVNAPDWDSEYGTAEMVAKFLGLHVGTFLALVDEGKLPGPTIINRETKLWRWDAVVGMSVLLPFLTAKETVKKNPAQKTGEN